MVVVETVRHVGFVGGAVVVVLLAGCLGTDNASLDPSPPASDPDPRDPNSLNFRPIVTVAVMDTGINPYHVEYREQYDEADPATYLSGYPKDVKVLTLNFNGTLGAQNIAQGDEDLWESTQDETLYRVAGTKIVGLIAFGGGLPGGGHGTMTTSRAAGNTISIGGPSVRLVLVRGFTPEGIRWAADQPWIDIMSISSGGSANVLIPMAGNVLDAEIKAAFQYAAHKKPFFASSGNGFGNAGLLGYPSWTRGASGVPDVVSVGANDNGKMSRWHNQDSYIVGDGCGNPAAKDGSSTEISNRGGGTSSATPFSAGGGAALLLEARRFLGDNGTGPRYADASIPSFSEWDSGWGNDSKVILAQGDPARNGITKGPLADGNFTLQEFKDVLYHTALEVPTEDKSDGNACLVLAGGELDPALVPGPVKFRLQGYGEVNQKSIDVAKLVLAGTETNPSRPLDDASYENAHWLKASVDG